MSITLNDLSKMIDHSLLHPTMGDKDIKNGCELAKRYNTASVCVKPYAVSDACHYLKDSDVKVGSVIGFPHGNSKVEIKVEETRLACMDGAVEIDMVINIGKALEGDLEYVKNEVKVINEEAIKAGAILKVIFENDYLTEDLIKQLSVLCSELNAAYIKTSTGYGFVKQPCGKYSYKGATENDLKIMISESFGSTAIKAAGGIRSLKDLLFVRSIGVSRVGCTATASILDEAKKLIDKNISLEELIPESLSGGL